MPQLATWMPPRPTIWQQFRREPAQFVARSLHRWRPSNAAIVHPHVSSRNPITVICVSDTHLMQPPIPDGDLLLHAGDLTNDGFFEELQAQLDWLASLPHRHKVVIAGNHDRLLDPEYVTRFPDKICEIEGQSRVDLDWHDLIYLNNSSKTLDFAGHRRLNIFGSPWTPQCGTFAFQYPPIRDVWTGTIPEWTDVLLTHGPPKGYLDLGGKGCPQLTREVARMRPKVVVFGHIHAGHGQQEVRYQGVEVYYQIIMAGDGGLATVLAMLFWFLGAWVMKVLSLLLGKEAGGRLSTTTMVNAALPGGLNGDKFHSASVLVI